MLGRIAITAWVAVIGVAITVFMALLIPSLPDIARYLRIRQM